MKDKTNVSLGNIAKGKSERNPNKSKFNQDHSDPSVAQPAQKPLPQATEVKVQEAAPLEAAKGNDEVMSQPPQPAATPVPKIDANLKLALHETAQEEIHQVMTKREARKLVVKEKPKASVKDKID